MSMSSRRDFMGMALGGFTALGSIGALMAMKKSWDPLPSVKSAGFTTIDLSDAKENEMTTKEWRGKPIFIMKKTADMEPHDRDIVVDGNRYLVTVGLCTHLGCIPAYRANDQEFLCACHGGRFDASGVNLPNLPPVVPLDIPPFSMNGTKLVLGETGPEYKKLLADGLTRKV